MGYFGLGSSGSVRVTADKALGNSKQPVRVYSATWLSDGTARSLILRNGTSSSGNIYVQAAGTASVSVTQNWEGGLRFPLGCFIDFTTSMVSIVLEYTLES